MPLSYWELKNWFTNVDFAIVGSGIVGLHCAIELKQRFPKAKILVLEKGILPQGASTKNAGFACFGSLSEILDDLKTHTEDEVVSLVEKRWNGLQLLRKNLGDKILDFRQYGGYELFLQQDEAFFDECVNQLSLVNQILSPIFKEKVFIKKSNGFGFQNIFNYLLYNSFEGQIDTGNMMQALLKKAIANDILILNQQNVTTFHDSGAKVEVVTNGISFYTNKLLLATNGFASELMKGDIKPARAQVLVTKPIEGLSVKGTFHLDRGYYYFRNIENRILFGGGRNLDFEGETTTHLGQTKIIQEQLEQLLKSVILPQFDFEIEHRWSGIMGVGNHKRPIVKQLSDNVACGVRLGGMGVAIGGLTGKELADLL
ncbi:FAD-binding oxidoreductase [Flavobacterium sp. NRK F10]|uniref:NAD(P)/FAD-dependent oxidoreductase n=1 Tax=Flavobacterium sp. NRK F10 TaxID=2954931 RepID=UPI002091C0D1|nr:FAD-dependent oxidoreductase [Flavobacterium sp. NRK F10]MCO6174418.1 FAD-binding oxidoreductase [Flavobacterium sp. NRK F10]